jgi:hypothetical protein
MVRFDLRYIQNGPKLANFLGFSRRFFLWEIRDRQNCQTFLLKVYILDAKGHNPTLISQESP